MESTQDALFRLQDFVVTGIYLRNHSEFEISKSSFDGFGSLRIVVAAYQFGVLAHGVGNAARRHIPFHQLSGSCLHLIEERLKAGLPISRVHRSAGGHASYNL